MAGVQLKRYFTEESSGLVRVGKGRRQHLSKLHDNADARRARGMCSQSSSYYVQLYGILQCNVMYLLLAQWCLKLWATWIETLGTIVVVLCTGFEGCENNYYNYRQKIEILSIPYLILLCFPFVLAFSYWKHHQFIAHPAQHNPYKAVIKVLNFARTHQWPLRCSAFTYYDDKRSSRIDFAKKRYREDRSQQSKWKMSKYFKGFLNCFQHLDHCLLRIFHPHSWASQCSIFLK